MTETAEPAAGQVFSRRAAIGIVLAVVFAFSAFITLLAYAPDLGRDPFCRPNVYSTCAVGFAGLRELADQDGAATLVSRGPIPRGRTEGLLIVTLEPRSRPAELGRLGFSGPILVVLPKWALARDPDRLSWGRKAGLIPPAFMPGAERATEAGRLGGLQVARRNGVAQPRLTGAPNAALAGASLTPGPIDRLQTMTAKGWTPVLTDERGAVVMAEAPGTRLYVLADPDLLNTQGLANLDTLTAAVALLRGLRLGEGPLIFDATLNGYRVDRNALKLMFDPPFLAVTVCVAVALALAAWQAFNRFGPLRRAGRAIALGKEGLADNSAQLIRLARREASMAPRYAALTRAAAAKAVGAPRDLVGDELTGFLDRLAAQRGAAESLGALSDEAGRVRDRPGLTALARRLYRWRLEMTRERR